MKTITINLYSFDELSEQAKQKALEQNAYINVEHNWWIDTYEDAERIGLKITGFDLEYREHCEGSIIDAHTETATKIISEHGKECNTYKLAERFLLELQAIEDKHNDSEDDDTRQEVITELENLFLNDLFELYAVILKDECDYLQSKEAIIETFEANDYTFEESGKMNNG